MNVEVMFVSGYGRILKYLFMEECGDVDQVLMYFEFDLGVVGDVEVS